MKMKWNWCVFIQRDGSQDERRATISALLGDECQRWAVSEEYGIRLNKRSKRFKFEIKVKFIGTLKQSDELIRFRGVILAQRTLSAKLISHHPELLLLYYVFNHYVHLHLYHRVQPVKTRIRRVHKWPITSSPWMFEVVKDLYRLVIAMNAVKMLWNRQLTMVNRRRCLTERFTDMTETVTSTM